MRRLRLKTAARPIIVAGSTVVLAVLALTALALPAPAATAAGALPLGLDSEREPRVTLPSAAAPAGERQDGPLQASGAISETGRPSSPGSAEPLPFVPGWVYPLVDGLTSQLTTGDLVVVKSIATESGDPTTAFNGEAITYTITITNVSGGRIDNVIVQDDLPRDTLEELSCNNGCEMIVEEQVIPEPLGGTIVVTVTRQVRWSLGSLANNAVRSLTIRGKVAGQTDGTRFQNRAFVSYKKDGVDRAINSNAVQTIARVPLPQDGQASLSDAPTWFSSDLGGTLSQDWGDFDRDGDLDLALASSIGMNVYRNDGGRLRWFWGNNRVTYGVRWADLNGDGTLELVTVGDSSGRNYLYSLAGDEFVQTGFFSSDTQLVRVEAGNFDADPNGPVDLLVSSNAINARCPVQLYRNDGQGRFPATGECVSTAASANMGPGDFDNDGDLDLALGLFPNTLRLLVNESGRLTATKTIPIDSSVPFLPYGFAWGDYDRDGYLDLAAAFPLQREIRIYRNQDGKSFAAPKVIRTNLFLTPLAVDWGDFNGDGRLELLVADAPPRVLQWDPATDAFTTLVTMAPGAVRGQVWSIRGVDTRAGANLDLSLSNRDRSSLLFTTFAPRLKTTLTAVDSSPAAGVAWGDVNDDGMFDLLFGAGSPGAGAAAFGSKLYYNNAGTFSAAGKVVFTGFGPHAVGFGDVNGDGLLDVALGTPAENLVYDAPSTTSPDWSSAAPHYGSNDLAWADADDDGALDLLVANDGPVTLYLNQGTRLSASPAWTSTESGDARSVAWGDVDGDRFLDFAVGIYGGPVRVYRNNRDGTFSLTWESGEAANTTAVAWADYDNDGDLDLAAAKYGQASVMYENVGGELRVPPVWTAPVVRKTTALAWGDWDNDGDLDLALGNDGEPVQVYANLESSPGSPRLVWLWTSSQAYRTSGLAWGDMDGDGDLDLAMSQSGGGQNGVFENTYVTPAHLTDHFTSTMTLPNNPSYLSIRRPGETADGYLFSSAEILSGLFEPTVAIEYTVFDPDGSRPAAATNGKGDPIARTIFEFSLDGGGTWRPATPATLTGTVTQTRRLGHEGTFLWDAVADEAISDDARFRITVVPRTPAGPVQRAATTAVSPPFRVRALTCLWPDNPSFSASPVRPSPGEIVEFRGWVMEASGVLTYTWDFGDGTPRVTGQVVKHRFTSDGTYAVKMTVEGTPCPISREVFATRDLVVGTGLRVNKAYLPLVRRAAGASAAGAAPGERPPAQVAGLSGTELAGTGATRLEWQPSPPSDGVDGYHIYHSPLGEMGRFRRVATVPGDVHAYTGPAVACGHVYYVTAFNRAGESAPSTASYATHPCRE